MFPDSCLHIISLPLPCCQAVRWGSDQRAAWTKALEMIENAGQ